LEGRLGAIAAGPKQNCLVLDFAGNTMRLGPINYPTLPKKKREGGGEPPARVCPQCGTIVHISVKLCPECGYEFPPPKKLTEQASTEELIAKRQPIKETEPPRYEVYAVEQMMGVRHSKAGKPDSVRVIYYTTCRRSVNQYVGLQHGGWFTVKSRDWCKMHLASRKDPVPETTDALLEAFHSLRSPTHVKVLVNGKYPEVTAYDFTGNAFEPQRLGMAPSAGENPAAAANHGPARGGPPLPELPDLHEFY
jgi:DNA repair protein RadD